MRLSVERVDQPGQESSFVFPCGAVTALSAPQSGIEQVPEGTTKHVEGVDDNRQEKPRPERQSRGHLHELPPFAADHTSPAGNLDGQPESQETQCRLADNHRPDVDGENNDDRGSNIGQHMTEQDSPFRTANRHSHLEIDILLDSNHGTADDSGTAHASGDPQHNDDLEETPSPPQLVPEGRKGIAQRFIAGKGTPSPPQLVPEGRHFFDLASYSQI